MDAQWVFFFSPKNEPQQLCPNTKGILQFVILHHEIYITFIFVHQSNHKTWKKTCLISSDIRHTKPKAESRSFFQMVLVGGLPRNHGVNFCHGRKFGWLQWLRGTSRSQWFPGTRWSTWHHGTGCHTFYATEACLVDPDRTGVFVLEMLSRRIAADSDPLYLKRSWR